MLTRYLKRRDNPWELLAIAFLFFGPGLALVVHQGPVLLISASNRWRTYRTLLTAFQAHMFGWWALSVASILVVLYFYARHCIARDEAAPPPHFLEVDTSGETILGRHRDVPYASDIQNYLRHRSGGNVAQHAKTQRRAFSFIGKHVVNMISGLYLAASLARVVGKFVPSLRLTTFVILAVCWILTGVAVIIREAHDNRESLATLGIGGLPPVIIGSAVILLVARVISNYEPAPPGFSIIIAEWGLMFWVGGYLVMMRNAYRQKKLEEDLAKKPSGASDQASQHSTL